MRFGRWLPLCVALWAAAAAGQPVDPVIVDPDGPDEDELDWQLDLEEVELVLLGDVPLALPNGLVFIGTKEIEEFLLLEKNTGRIRHFTTRVEQAVALDLAVDTCDDRGLIGIALHPEFEFGVPAVDAENPEHDWIYVSYHSGGGCGGAAVFHVDRYTWNGTALVSPVSIYTKDLLATETTKVGGAIATALDLQLSVPIALVPRLYILIGSLGHDGRLQNNADGADLDDTSVLLRLDEDGTTPPDNPFDDPDTVTPETKDRYFAYGIGDPRGMATDPAAQTPWFAEYSDAGKPDEINLLFGASNGGYSDYQGWLDPDDVPKNTEDDYPLFDLDTTNEDDPAEEKPISTFLLPRFSFEDDTIKPTGVAFGGTEVGPQHRQDLFVGTQDGQLFRFNVLPGRNGLQLTGEILVPPVAQKEVLVDDPTTPADERRDADDLKDILIANGFGRISELETGSDGSIYVVDQEFGKIWRVFFDAERDLAVVSVKAPSKISLSTKKPVVSKSIKLSLVNNGEVSERIDSHDDLMAFLGMEIVGVGPANCQTPAFDVIDPKYVSPPYNYPIGIKANGGKLALEVSVQWTCNNGPGDPNPVAGVPDFETTLDLNPAAIGVPESDELPDAEDNNVCPRPTTATDPGCGNKGGGDIVTDIIQK